MIIWLTQKGCAHDLCLLGQNNQYEVGANTTLQLIMVWLTGLIGYTVNCGDVVNWKFYELEVDDHVGVFRTQCYAGTEVQLQNIRGGKRDMNR